MNALELLVWIIPLLCAIGAALASRRDPLRIAKWTTLLAAIFASGFVLFRILGGAIEFLAQSARAPETSNPVLDGSASAMLLLVTGLGAVIARYSATYLAGQRGLERYSGSLLLALASVTSLVISDHLGVIVAAWAMAGMCVHVLLTFYRERPQAEAAARKKFLLSRLADVSLFSSLLLIQSEVGSLRLGAIGAFAQSHEVLSSRLHLATVLFALGVVLKSAQLPFHGWMTQVMEAPTPVSALLHAGIVNIGGFLLIRLHALFVHAWLAQGLLVAFGLATAIAGTLVMTTRVSIKVSLAWSTISQLGFMLVQCGLGMWHIALLHLLAHSVYKAHAFLRAGSVVEAWKQASFVKTGEVSVAAIAFGTAIAFAASSLVAWFCSALLPEATVSIWGSAVVISMSLGGSLARTLGGGWRATARLFLFSTASCVSYVALHAYFGKWLPELREESVFFARHGCAIAGLCGLYVVHTLVYVRPHALWWRQVQPELFGGFFLDEWLARVAHRLWTPRSAIARVSVHRLTKQRGASR